MKGHFETKQVIIVVRAMAHNRERNLKTKGMYNTKLI